MQKTESPLAHCVICGDVVQIHPAEDRRQKRCAACVGESLQVVIVPGGVISPREVGDRA